MRKNKKVVIFGGTSPLGLALIDLLLQERLQIIATYNKTKPKEKKSEVFYQKLDVSSQSEIENFFKRLDKDVSCFVSLVGRSAPKKFIDCEKQFVDELFNINFISQYELISRSAKYFLNLQKQGKIIVVTSLNALFPLPNWSIYSASKHALHAMLLSASYELKKKGIQLTAVASGAIKRTYFDKDQKQYLGLRERNFIFGLLLPFLTYEKVAHEIVLMIKSNKNPRELIIGRDAKLMYVMSKFLPRSLWHEIIQRTIQF
ncbi:MAG: SDR family NAD(P)-dependent oxidoreductase [Patescibacteria group bacterium]|nr:SDR family NAD(P)-dependent oxidoreductase [Patescibacteria group bacterium]